MAGPADAYIELTGVHKRFGSVEAVRGVTLTVRRNEFVTLLGPSGCGKTTLLRLIGGFEEPDSGSVAVDGQPVESTPPRLRRTRMVFQHYALFPHMTVFENVAFGLRMRGIPAADRRRRVHEVLETVRLADKTAARPSQLSGGQQQRVALARAIVTEPTVLLLDEPLAALDLQLRKRMQIELKTLQRSLGITFIYVTHDQGEALTMSDRIVVMDRGRVEQVGSGEEIYDRPASPFVARFIGEANIFALRVVGHEHGAVIGEIDGVRLALPAPSDAPPRVGERAAVMVRPERMMVRDPADARPALAGQVIQRIYLGATTRLIVALGNGAEALVDMSSAGSWAPGSSVSLGWDASAVRWLATPEQDATAVPAATAAPPPAMD